MVSSRPTSRTFVKSKSVRSPGEIDQDRVLSSFRRVVLG